MILFSQFCLNFWSMIEGICSKMPCVYMQYRIIKFMIGLWKILSQKFGYLGWSLSPDTINREVTKVCPLIFRKTLPGVLKESDVLVLLRWRCSRDWGLWRGSSVREAWQGARWGSQHPLQPLRLRKLSFWCISARAASLYSTAFSDNPKFQLSGHFVGSLENPSTSAVSWGIKTGSSPFQINALTCCLCFYFSPHTL